MAKEIYALNAEVRERSGKGAARAARRNKMLPAVIYGAGEEPINVNINAHDLYVVMTKGGFYTNFLEVNIKDGKTIKVLPRDVQVDPVKDKPLHVDFLRFNPKSKLSVNIGVQVVGEDQSPGIEEGGIVQLVRNEIELMCRADSIPDVIVIDVSKLGVGDSLHISEIDLPEGVEPTVERDFTVASIVSTRSMADEEADAEAEAELEAAAEEGIEGEGAEAAAEEGAEGEGAEGEESAEGEDAKKEE